MCKLFLPPAMDKGNLSPTQPQSLILHHVYVLRDAVSYPTPSASPPYCHYRPHTVSTASGLPYAATPVAALTTPSLFDVFPIFPTLPKCSHPPHHPFGNPCELTLHSLTRGFLARQRDSRSVASPAISARSALPFSRYPARFFPKKHTREPTRHCATALLL